VEITATSQLFALKAQSRRERTQDAQQQSENVDTGTCGVESKQDEDRDDSFQLLIVGHGPGTIKWIRAFCFQSPEDQSGEPGACVNEEEFNLIRFDGVGVHSTDIDVGSEEISEKTLQRYTAIKTEIFSESGITAVGVGFSESVVSQDAADRVASIIASKQAENEVIRALPPVISVGEGLE
jgi:hypothetical protein